MLVFGDRIRTEDSRDKLLRLAADLRALADAPPGIERHGRLVAAFIEASEVLQGVADAEFAQAGYDATSPLQDRLLAFLLDLAHSMLESWASGFAHLPKPPVGVAESLATEGFPPRIAVKSAEGYAFYALYPEAYAIAARMLQRGDSIRVIGLRSIGAGLAAVVAAATGADSVTTLRPVGPPFRRRLALAPALVASLVADLKESSFAVVDEGPGLSGSSFGAVADVLEDLGVPGTRIAFLPSHAGDLGPQAEPRHRIRWAGARRHVVDFDNLILRAKNPAHRLEAWVADLVGAPQKPLQDISGGAWRALRFEAETEWPAAHVGQERRKFLAHTASGAWLLKFAGLGGIGLRKLDRARVLAEAGFAPETAGFRHGFLVERWRDDASPLRMAAIGRRDAVRQVGRYLAFRARHFPAEPGAGASLSELAAMARHNAAEAFGENAVMRRFDALSDRIAALERRIRRIETDNRMHLWEWLAAPNGRLIKTDALDHHDAHDLIGCQDVAWDVAGAAVEWDLSSLEQDDLCAVVARESGRPVDLELLAFLTPCYLAFQLGHHAVAAAALEGLPEEAARLRAAENRYAKRLRRVLNDFR